MRGRMSPWEYRHRDKSHWGECLWCSLPEATLVHCVRVEDFITRSTPGLLFLIPPTARKKISENISKKVYRNISKISENTSQKMRRSVKKNLRKRFEKNVSQSQNNH